jgi:DNA methylase
MSAADVIAGQARYSVECAEAHSFLQSLPSRSVSLVFFSPPYERQRTYGLKVCRSGQVWVDWLRPIVIEAARVSNGLVIVNAHGPVKKGQYSPSMEWLCADLTRLDGLVCGPSPFVWWKVCATPGSGGKRYQRRDWEPLYAFCLPDRLPLQGTDNKAFGHPPKEISGKQMSHRNADGTRVNDPWGKRGRGNSLGGRNADGTKRLGSNAPGSSRRANGEYKAAKRHTKRKTTAQPNGRMEEQWYAPPETSNPGNVIKARVGGGHLGSKLAHDSEAPMALAVAERFVCWYAPEDGIILDPFCGSATTGHAAKMHGRKFIGCDIRPQQVELASKRLMSVAACLPGL